LSVVGVEFELEEGRQKAIEEISKSGVNTLQKAVAFSRSVPPVKALADGDEPTPVEHRKFTTNRQGLFY